MSRGDPDAKAGEAARADADQDSRRDMAVEHFLDHRHQPLGMAAADQLVARRDDRSVPLQQGGGAGGGRRVEREDQRRDSYCLDAMEAQAARRRQAKSEKIE